MWFVYVVRCADDSLYCGIARDVAARLAEHEAGTGAKYTRGRGPLRLVHRRGCRDKGTALRLEYLIKQLPRAEKDRLDAKQLARLARRARVATRLARRASE